MSAVTTRPRVPSDVLGRIHALRLSEIVGRDVTLVRQNAPIRLVERLTTAPPRHLQ